MKKITFTLVFLLFLSACAAPNNSANEPNIPESNDFAETEELWKPYEEGDPCGDFAENSELIKKPFMVDSSEEGFGYAAVSGTITKKSVDYGVNDPGPALDEVFLVMEEPLGGASEKAFYAYFRAMLESGNTVNFGAEDLPTVGFKLGTLQDEEFSTTAHINDLTKAKIMEALASSEPISLTLRIPKYMGRGAPQNFSFACVIE